MPTIRCKVKLFYVIIEVIFLEKRLQFLLRGKFDPTGAVDINIPSTGLLTVLTALQFSDPTRGQRLVLKLEHFGQMGGPPANFDAIATASTVMVTPSPSHTHCCGGRGNSRGGGVSADPG